MKGVLRSGTARGQLSDFASRRPAFGKTGTQQNNWTAFFVGATPELSTAVMVRDPDRYTPMRNIPEFNAAGVYRVCRAARSRLASGGPTWNRSALEQFEFTDWDRPEPRPTGRRPACTCPATSACSRSSGTSRAATGAEHRATARRCGRPKVAPAPAPPLRRATDPPTAPPATTPPAPLRRSRHLRHRLCPRKPRPRRHSPACRSSSGRARVLRSLLMSLDPKAPLPSVARRICSCNPAL